MVNTKANSMRENSITLSPEDNSMQTLTSEVDMASDAHYHIEGSGSDFGRRLRTGVVAVVGVVGLGLGISLGYAAFSSEENSDGPSYPIGSEQAEFESQVVARKGLGTYGTFPCDTSESQSPRDVSPGSPGELSTKGKLPARNFEEWDFVNFHMHVGAEHKSDGEYDILTPWDGLGDRPGYLCNSDFDQNETVWSTAYDFQYCEHVIVGGTYELHWVHSTGGLPAVDGLPQLTDGLGGAFARVNNPFVGVQSQAIKIANVEGPVDESFLFGMDASDDVAAYLGSTTGTTYDNEKCSPFQVTWHVDRECKMVSAATLDNACRIMKESYNMVNDLHPHSSRVLVSEEWSSKDLFELDDLQ